MFAIKVKIQKNIFIFHIETKPYIAEIADILCELLTFHNDMHASCPFQKRGFLNGYFFIKESKNPIKWIWHFGYHLAFTPSCVMWTMAF